MEVILVFKGFHDFRDSLTLLVQYGTPTLQNKILINIDKKEQRELKGYI